MAKLGKISIMSKSKYAFRYIDLCWLNVDQEELFIDPLQPRVLDNPYWVYPLDIIEIKIKLSQVSEHLSKLAIKVHFMNALLVSQTRILECLPCINSINGVIYHSTIHSSLSSNQTNL